MEITFRRANADDLTTIVGLWDNMCRTEENCGEDEYGEILAASEEALSNPDKALFIAFEGGKAVGYSHAIIRREWFFEQGEGGQFGFLDTIYVRPGYRRKGVAQKLVAMCEDWAREKNCAEFASTCDLDNEGSYKFHTGIGFREMHRIIHFTKSL